LIEIGQKYRLLNVNTQVCCIVASCTSGTK